MKLIAVLFCALLWSCGGDKDDDKDPAPAPVPSPGPTPPGGQKVTFSQVLPVIQKGCWGTSCHNKANGPGGVSLLDYNGIAANLAKGLNSVAAGRMPKDGRPVSAEEIALLRQWALDGYLK
jgi:hypothetical protein